MTGTGLNGTYDVYRYGDTIPRHSDPAETMMDTFACLGRGELDIESEVLLLCPP